MLEGYNMIQPIRLFLGTYSVFYAQSSVIEETKNSLDSVELVRICKNLRRKRATSVFRSVSQKKGLSRRGKTAVAKYVEAEASLFETRLCRLLYDFFFTKLRLFKRRQFFAGNLAILYPYYVLYTNPVVH